MLRRRLALIALLTWLPGMAAATTIIDPVSGAFPFDIITGENTNIDLKLTTDDPVVAVNIEFVVTGFMQITGCSNFFGVPGFNCTPIADGVVFSAGDFTNGLPNDQGLVRLSVTATGPVGTLTLARASDAAGIITNYTFCTNGGPPCLNPLDQSTAPFDNPQPDIIAVVTPEPGTLGLLGAGLLALGWAGSRARRG